MADESNQSVASDTEEQKGTTIAEDLVVTKYKMAAEITNRKFICGLFLFLYLNVKILSILYNLN
jgi:hypothetical protein